MDENIFELDGANNVINNDTVEHRTFWNVTPHPRNKVLTSLMRLFACGADSSAGVAEKFTNITNPGHAECWYRKVRLCSGHVAIIFLYEPQNTAL